MLLESTPLHNPCPTTNLRGWDITVIGAFWQIIDDFMNLGFASSGPKLVCGIRYSCVLNIGKEELHQVLTISTER